MKELKIKIDKQEGRGSSVVEINGDPYRAQYEKGEGVWEMVKINPNCEGYKYGSATGEDPENIYNLLEAVSGNIECFSSMVEEDVKHPLPGVDW